MKNKNIAVDFDGVLGRTMSTVCDFINILTGENHTHKNITKWNYWHDLGYENQFNRILDYFDREGRLMIKPYDSHIFKALWNLKGKGFYMDIVSANDKKAEASIWAWVNIHGKFFKGGWPISNIKCIGRVSADEKLKLDYDIFIDDSPHLAEAAGNNLNKFVCLANAPWNKMIQDTKNVKRFESWKEIPELINNLKNE